MIDSIRIEVAGEKKTQFSSLLLELQHIVRLALDLIIKQSNEKPLAKSNIASIIILRRIIESTQAGAILVENNYYRDASVLLTNQIELRLDMQYISQDYKNAEIWLKHDKKFKKPWRVKDLQTNLFLDKNELQAEKEIYMKFSMVKHGNPVSESFGFPISIKNSLMFIASNEDKFFGKYAFYYFAFFNELFRTFSASVKDFIRCDFNLIEQVNKADFINRFMSDIHNKNILEQVHYLDKITHKPHLCKSCSAFPKDKIEITCLLKQNNSANNFSCDKYLARKEQ